MKILFLTNIPSPYRVDFFNDLGKRCKLTVLFEKLTSAERDESWKMQRFVTFQGIVLKGRSTDVDKAICFDVLKYLKQKLYDVIIVSNVSTPTGMLAIQYMKLRRIPFMIEGDGGFAKNGRGFKEAVKRYFISNAKGYFSTSLSHDQYYLAYGANPEKIYRYHFTSLSSMDILPELPCLKEKAAAKLQLGFINDKMVLAVGQFIFRKGFDVLLKACENLEGDVCVTIVGGKPTAEYLQLVEQHNLHNVRFIEFKSKSELKEYYKAADLFVMPTREDVWGLVINEAMACGLPVITSNRCVAGLELVEDGVTGYIIPVEDDALLANRINLILHSEELCGRLATNSLAKIRSYTIEQMAQDHIDIIKNLP